MIKRMIIMLILCALVLGGAFGYKIFVGKMMMAGMAAMGDAPQSVSATKAVFESWQDEIRAVGTFVAVQGADIAPEVQGVVEEIPFESGQDIEQGAVLVRLRDAEEKAAFDVLRANLELAEQTLKRSEKQLAAQAISKAAYDADKADVESLRAQIVGQQAALDKKTLRAPFAGRLGIRLVTVGQYVSAGTPFVSLQQLDPLFVDFTLPQQNLPLLALGQKIAVTTDAVSGKIFEGTLTAFDSKVDEKTRNIAVRALVPNPDKLLRPGLFASLSLTVGAPHDYLTLPQTAVTYNPYGNIVFVVHPADDSERLLVRTAFVKTGPIRGDQIAILDGIKEGDEIVTSGQMKLRNGSFVVINNTAEPLDDPAPQPKDK